jgi:hypothetical protein
LSDSNADSDSGTDSACDDQEASPQLAAGKRGVQAGKGAAVVRSGPPGAHRQPLAPSSVVNRR